MTLELYGVNARSPIRRKQGMDLTPRWIASSSEPDLSPNATASFQLLGRGIPSTGIITMWCSVACPATTRITGRIGPASSSRKASAGCGSCVMKWTPKRGFLSTLFLLGLERKKLFLLPLQLSGDFQIRAHSPFPDMQGGGPRCDRELRQWMPRRAPTWS